MSTLRALTRHRFSLNLSFALPVTIISILFCTDLFANKRTITRTDYDKSDYLLVATTLGETNPDYAVRVDTFASGFTGNGSTNINIGRNVKLPNPANHYALTGIAIEEEWNKPCKIVLFGMPIDPRYQSEARVLAREELTHCKNSAGISMHAIDYSDEFPAYFDFTKYGKKFLSSIRVCNGGSKFPSQFAYSSEVWKIKGFETTSTEVRMADETVLKAEVSIPRQLPRRKVRAHCPNTTAATYKPGWHPEKSCEHGQIVVGVEAFDFDNKWFTGLRPICKSVAARRITQVPRKDASGLY